MPQEISFFLFITGGAFYIINRTGMIKVVLGGLVDLLGKVEYIVVSTLLFLLGIVGELLDYLKNYRLYCHWSYFSACDWI